MRELLLSHLPSPLTLLGTFLTKEEWPARNGPVSLHVVPLPSSKDLSPLSLICLPAWKAMQVCVPTYLPHSDTVAQSPQHISQGPLATHS